MADDQPSSSAPMFRKPKKRPAQTRVNKPDDEVDDAEAGHSLEDIREVQNLRNRRHGLNAVECAVGKELARQFDQLDENPFQMRGGGMLRLSKDKKAMLEAVEIEHDIKEQFKAETLLRDEHEEMRKYVESRLNKNGSTEDSEVEAKKFKPQNLEDEILYRAADKIKQFQSKSNDELLSNQMLVGIPEVDLGLTARMNNIIQTEQKKQQLLKSNKLPAKDSIPLISPDDPALKKLRR
uniref:Hepatocellular carcinoma-associated antigen 59 n=1 Tax=Panagrellus redivivus TaxID=6233 RepID=A0A7E4UQA4_PANRE